MAGINPLLERSEQTLTTKLALTQRGSLPLIRLRIIRRAMCNEGWNLGCRKVWEHLIAATAWISFGVPTLRSTFLNVVVWPSFEQIPCESFHKQRKPFCVPLHTTVLSIGTLKRRCLFQTGTPIFGSPLNGNPIP